MPLGDVDVGANVGKGQHFGLTTLRLFRMKLSVQKVFVETKRADDAIFVYETGYSKNCRARPRKIAWPPPSSFIYRPSLR